MFFVAFLTLCFSKPLVLQSQERSFLNWMRTNNKFYAGDEYHFRLGIFLSHSHYCQNFNRRNDITFRVSTNKFSCYTPSEYKSILGVRGFRKIISPKTNKNEPKIVAPDSYDWRNKGLVNPIKDQASCGSCWAFSAVAACESAYAFTTGNLLQFSEQNFVDCANCYGCSGGWADSACYYAISDQNGQFNSESDYPYTAVDGTCSYDSSKAIGKITKLISVEWRDENDLKEKIAQYGVASVSISAGNTPFMSYSSGILDDEECQPLSDVDHAVAAVGYGSENGIDYWIVRNSWGTSWGEEGYVRMIRNKDNQCQIASQAFVIVDSE